jgi:hypothetical protein
MHLILNSATPMHWATAGAGIALVTLASPLATGTGEG